MDIGIIDVGIGNVGSVANMLRKTGYDSKIITKKDQLKACQKIILPGVGRFDKGMEALQKFDLIDTLKDEVKNNQKIVLGICLGMQLLFESSEEGDQAGLGLIEGKVTKFSSDIQLPIPHVGWSMIKTEKSNLLISNLDQYYFYFVHSYHAPINNMATLSTCVYGYEYPAVVQKGNIYGAQFHPEKSLHFGFKFFSNFALLSL